MTETNGVLPRNVKGMGWIPDLPDFRDRSWSVMHAIQLPAKASLRDKFPPCYNQGLLGSCTGNAIAGALEFDRRKQGLKDFVPSRLMIYWLERFLEHTVSIDAGAQIRDGMKAVARWGACDEALWPYDIEKFAEEPSHEAYAQALETQAIDYARVTRTRASMKATIVSGFPIVFGFAVYESFEGDAVAKTGIVPMPDKAEKQVGGHAVVLVGYDDATQNFEVRNSWGTAWGQDGYCWMPMSYLIDPNLADDFWVIRSVGKRNTMSTRILLLDRDPPQTPHNAISVDIANEPGTEAPQIVFHDGKAFRRWLGLGLNHLRDGDQYVLTTSATAAVAKEK